MSSPSPPAPVAPRGDAPDGAAALDPEAAAALATGPPTARRVAVDRARRALAAAPRRSRAPLATAALLFALDLAVAAALLWGLPFMAWEPPRAPLVLAALLAGLALGAFVAGGYRPTPPHPFGRAVALAGPLGLALAWILLKAVATKLDAKPWTPPAAPGFALALALIALALALTRAAARRRAARAAARAPLLFVGPAPEALALRARLAAAALPHPLVHFDPDLPDPAAAPADPAGPWPLAALDAHVRGDVRAIVLAVPPDALPAAAVADLVHYRVIDVPVRSPRQLVEELWERTPLFPDDRAGYLFDERLHPGHAPVYQGAKRALDVALAAVGLALAAPLLAALALAVRLGSPGPALHRQERLGLWKRPFTLYKLRTMRADAEADGARWAAPGDARVTPLGRLLRRSHLDELPQLYNVLRGDMALVGPRPERPAFTRRLETLLPHYDLRHLVRPGLTGWAQVSYPYGATLEDAVAKLEYDLYYLKHASFGFDLRILARTVAVVLGLRGR